MSRFLQLVGAARYTHSAFGTVSKGDTVGPIDDEELVDRLLEKGTLLGTDDDTFLKPYFKEVGAPKGYKAPRMQTEEEAAQEAAREAELSQRLAAANKPQAPVGQGPNGAETVVDESEMDVNAEPGDAQDPAYHSEDPADNDGNDGLSDSTKNDPLGTEAEGTATTKVARQRSAAKK
jgi:hypothetical protein